MASELEVKAAEMFVAGESVNAVAKALFSVNGWREAKKLFDVWKERGGVMAGPGKPRGGRPKKAVEWELFLRSLGGFTAQEQAHAVGWVLQQRVDAAAGE